MSDMADLLKQVYDKNAEFGSNQDITHGEIPETILMIDKTTRKKISPQMQEFYKFALSWKEGILGFDVVDPNQLAEFYQRDNISESISLKGEDYKPSPPSDPSDWSRTALMAVEAGGDDLGVCFYWWRHNEDVEPCVIYISGGTVDTFADVNELVDYLANGTFPEKGDGVYKELQAERGTLSD